MKKRIAGMSAHHIVCGYGKLGREVAVQLTAEKVPFVVVETDAQKALAAREGGYAVIEGDATKPETLADAGLARAAGIAATMSDDAENLYIGIAVRAARPGIPVVCRSSSDRVRALFRMAGIEQTISTDEIGAQRLVAALTRPQITGFMDEITRPVEGRPSLHAVRLEEGAGLIGRSILASRLREEYGIVVLAIQRGGRYLPNPRADEVLRRGDILILIGEPERVAGLRATLEDSA